MPFTAVQDVQPYTDIKKGIDKKVFYVHNTSYYDTQIYRVQSRFCPFLFDTAVSAER